jgi:hypothetical protein
MDEDSKSVSFWSISRSLVISLSVCQLTALLFAFWFGLQLQLIEMASFCSLGSWFGCGGPDLVSGRRPVIMSGPCDWADCLSFSFRSPLVFSLWLCQSLPSIC